MIQNGDTKMINSPIKWVGGKSRFRTQIVSLLPQHSCYVELFAGGAWVLFAKPLSPVEILNDIDQELINFYRVLRERPNELIESFEWELASRAEFERLADADPHTMTDVQRAHRFFYLIMAGWGGEFNYPRFQTSITDGGHGNRLIGALKHLQDKLLPVHKRLQTVIIECLDWQTCFTRYDRSKVVMYIDPPYPDNKVNYHHNMRSWEEHERLAFNLRRAQCDWILSSYDKPEIRHLYDRHYIIPVQAFSGMVVKKGEGERVLNKEVLITNFPPPGALAQHILSHPQLDLGLADQ